jgi:hypothetical protein
MDSKPGRPVMNSPIRLPTARVSRPIGHIPAVHAARNRTAIAPAVSAVSMRVIATAVAAVVPMMMVPMAVMMAVVTMAMPMMPMMTVIGPGRAHKASASEQSASNQSKQDPFHNQVPSCNREWSFRASVICPHAISYCIGRSSLPRTRQKTAKTQQSANYFLSLAARPFRSERRKIDDRKSSK